jgi:hypothetical protein
MKAAATAAANKPHLDSETIRTEIEECNDPQSPRSPPNFASMD